MANHITWIRRVYQAMRKLADALLADYGVTHAQLEVLLNLWEEDGLEQRVLTERIGINKASLTSLIDGLVERGIVTRQPNADDARVKQVFLTVEGQALYEKLQVMRPQFEEQLLKGFSPSEAALLEDWLKRLAINLGVSSKL